jgi:SAM-dependent methyltransferase
MPDSVRAFYDQLADSYHLTYADWRKDVARQGAVLDRLLRSILGPGPHDVLDCACGIGTQAIGLAARGHRVRASDLSAASVERARTEAGAFGVDVDFAVADMRTIGGGPYDVVLACDNVLAHLLTDEEVVRALEAVRRTLRPGGVFITSLADYDEALRLRQRATTPKVFEDPAGTRVVLTLVDWRSDGRTYDITLFLLRRGGQEWAIEHHTTTERGLLRDEVAVLLEKAGFAQVRWHLPSESGFFQPIVTARL